MKQGQIPKIIHYCWFGRKEKPPEVQYCISTWRKTHPDYQIMEWNEENFSIADAVPYVQEAYSREKWAFVSDYVRLCALRTYGGIYLDTDVEVFRSLDGLLEHPMFMGFESKDYLTTAVIGSVPNFPVIQDFLEAYRKRHFILQDGSMDLETTNVVFLTKLMGQQGLVLNGRAQQVSNVTVFPQWYFSPNDFINVFGKYRKRSYTYHHFHASWYETHNRKGIFRRLRQYALGIARNVIGTQTLYRIRHR